jgi:lipopolysaccharide assembly protein A
MVRRVAASTRSPAPIQPPAQHAVKRTRISGLWVALVLFAVVLLLLLVFIVENSQRLNLSYFGAHGHLPLGVALLLTAVLGILLAVMAWFGRGVQVRTAARRERKT